MKKSLIKAVGACAIFFVGFILYSNWIVELHAKDMAEYESTIEETEIEMESLAMISSAIVLPRMIYPQAREAIMVTFPEEETELETLIEESAAAATTIAETEPEHEVPETSATEPEHEVPETSVTEVETTVEETQPETTSVPETTIAESGPPHYYGIYSNEWWHFTPEEIDNAWNGRGKNRPVLPAGTTRGWQSYLYNKLAENGVAWWYKYAVAQAMQESGFNPLNNEGIDWGLFCFRHYYWNPAYGDIFDYHANINAYVDRILPYLQRGECMDTVYIALSQHYNPTGQIYMDYVQLVLDRLNELWICN